jgi:TolB-like protein
MKCPKCHSENPDTLRVCGTCAALLDAEIQGSPLVTKTIATPVHGLAKGTTIAGKYRILEELGHGGMGIVYKAEDTRLQRTVALKFLPPQWTSDSQARERFIQEARAASALDHPNICTIYEIGETEDGRMFIAMGCYEGESLREKLRQGLMKAEEALGVATQVAMGMEKAHGKGIIHRDIKPANILITTDGVAKIVDFGLAKLAGQVRMTKEGSTVGTVAYMSPEQAKGEAVDQRTDIWSLGVVLYEMLTGLLPFKGDYEKSVIRSIMKDEPAPVGRLRKDLPSGLGPILAKVLEKRPADRYQTMDELLEDLNAVAEGLKPVRAASMIFRGRVLGIKKAYAYPTMAGIVILVVLAGLFLFPNRSQAFDSIAVLPFVNQSGNPEDAYFSDGVHADLIRELSRVRGIKKVIAQNSMMSYRGTTKKSSEIARELGVAAIVSGTASHVGGRVRISFEISDGQTDKFLGGDRFDGEYRDILALQGEAALAIAKRIQSTLTPEETRALSDTRRVVPEAYDAYMKGRNLLDLASQNGDPRNLLKSIPYFEQALRIDPDFAPSYAGLALTYDYGGSWGAGAPEDLFPKAIEAAKKALSLDESLADAHLVLADAKNVFEWDYEGSEKEFRRLLELNPNHAMAHAWYAVDLASTGRGTKEEIILHAERGRELDPLNYSIGEVVANAYNEIHDYDKAILQAKENVRLHPGLPGAYSALSLAYQYARRFDEALAVYQKASDLGFPPGAIEWALFYARSGDRSKAEKYLSEYLGQSDGRLVFPFYVAGVYSELGEKDKAFEWIEKMYEQRVVMAIKADATFDNLRSDPRFAKYMKKFGLDK